MADNQLITKLINNTTTGDWTKKSCIQCGSQFGNTKTAQQNCQH